MLASGCRASVSARGAWFRRRSAARRRGWSPPGAPRPSSGSSQSLAAEGRPIVAGPWLGEVGFELLYWIPFLRWFAERYEVPPERLIAVSRGGSAAAGTRSFAGRSHDALSFMALDEFRRKNEDRSGRLGEQKQVAETPLDEEIISLRASGGRATVSVLHPSIDVPPVCAVLVGTSAARVGPAIHALHACSRLRRCRWRLPVELHGGEVLLQ